jgi:hypothetical protein
MNKWYLAVAASLALALAACGSTPDDAGVAACEKKIAEEAGGKSFEVDRNDMKANAKPAGDNQVEINSTVCFDCKLPSEKKQSFMCKVRFDPNNPSAEPSVVGFTFVW